MRLRTFESFWLVKNGILYSYPSLQEDLKTEILVIGGGITGALTSHALMESGYQVTLIDRRDIAMGSSSATTSMLQYEIDVPLYELSEMIGEESAATCYRAGVQAIFNLKQLVDSLQLDCGFEMKESLYLAHSKKASTWLRKEFKLREKHELGVKWLSASEVTARYGMISHGAILSEVAASVDAYKLAHELIQYNVKRGMTVYDQTEIDQIVTTTPQPSVLLSTGNTIQAEKIICCTGFESTKMLKEKVADLFYTYATVSEQGILVNEQVKRTIFWNTANPYLYMRTTDDGRFLIGGEDSAFNIPLFQQRIKERKSDILIKKLEKILPEIEFIEDFSWAGTFGTTKDGLPYIGASPEFDNMLFVLGFGGNGITFSVQGMELVVNMLQGKPHPLAKFYRFGR
ncbi:NAD(P)/FAD-dependent oxidoreductase [Algoriphagus litoralis]|uniref:NAD(P)/FAD-dependent oxidoreductase n=1 Tax=Algoriphagus litoralis TaxID=2202829 RepID=UPI000DBAC613|nr:FAD-dependent oxidoreductase [Algoriphagus litoralis]